MIPLRLPIQFEWSSRFAPAGSVAAARVVFQPESSDQWWAVSMKPEGPAYFGILPKPKRTLAAFRYYIEVTDRAMATSRTPDYTTAVVSGAGECNGKLVAGQLGAASVVLQGPAGTLTVPAGFAPAGVVAAGSVAGGAAAATVAGASTGGGIGAGVIVAGAAAAAAGVAVAAKSGGEDSSANPGSSSATTPAPSPTPAVSTMGGRWAGSQTITNTATGVACTDDVTLDLVQTGGAFSGSGTTVKRATPGCTATTGRYEGVAGNLNGSSFTFSWHFIFGSSDCLQTGTGTLSGSQATGTFAGQCLTSAVTTFTLTRQ